MLIYLSLGLSLTLLMACKKYPQGTFAFVKK